MSKRLKIEKKYYPPNIDQICYFVFFPRDIRKENLIHDAFGKAFEFRSLKPLLPNGSEENHQFSGLTKTHPQGSLANPVFRDMLLNIDPTHNSGLRLVHLESKYSWNIALRCFLRFEVPICHQEQVRKCCSKIGSINVYVRLGKHIKMTKRHPKEK